MNAATLRASDQRIPALDGWRAIAILLVLIDHSNLYCGFPFPGLMYLGQHGVTLFFVLSGYLITTRLQIEKRETGQVSLKAFYLRRFFRILPCAWTYLIFLAVYRDIRLHDALSCVFFFRNFATSVGDTLTVHFWSLSIEEQFYLIWPGILILLGSRRGRQFAIVIACAIAAFRFTHWEQLNRLPFLVASETQWRADSLLVGCAAALLPNKIKLPERVHRLLLWVAVVALVACIFRFHEIIPLFESSVMAFLIWSTSTRESSILNRILGSGPFKYLGVRSYSLYVWQGYAFRIGLPFDVPSYAIKLVFLALFATGSYFYVEKPMIRYGARLIQRLNLNHEPSPSTV